MRKYTGKLKANITQEMFTALSYVLIFSFLARGVATNDIIAFDEKVTGAIRAFTSPQLTSFMKGITFFGNIETLLVIIPLTIAVFFIARRLLTEPLMLTISAIGSWLMVEIIKWLYHRPRPNEHPLVDASGFSFPSGHAVLSISFYMAVAYLLYNSTSSPLIRRIIIGSFTLFAILIGISRVYLGLHYPSDVLAGYVAGGAWLTICIIIKQMVNQKGFR